MLVFIYNEEMAELADAHIRGVKFSPCLKHSSMNVDVQCRFKPYSLHKDFPIGEEIRII